VANLVLRPALAGASDRARSGMTVSLDTDEPLTLAHGDELRPLLAARWGRDLAEAPQATLSDPWFANLLLFRTAHGWRLRRGEWPCIAGHTYDGARVLLPLFDLATAPRSVLRDLLRGHDAFAPLSAAQAARLPAGHFGSSASRDDADYVYPAEQFRTYRGTLLQKKRNLVKQLLARHRVEAVAYAEALAAEASPVLDAWLAAKGKPAGTADDTACREALGAAGRLGLEGTLYRIDGRAVGFVLAEPVAPGVMVMRFAKGLDAYKGLYQHMFQAFCQARPALRWLNFEQDLGLANFRQTKQSYQPAMLLAKHRVTLK
jgi:uncharacterized protein